MWKFGQLCSKHVSQQSRNKLGSIGRGQFSAGSSGQGNNPAYILRAAPAKQISSATTIIQSWLTRTAGLTCGGLLGAGFKPCTVLCEPIAKAGTGRLTGLHHVSTAGRKFDWPKFWAMLRPDLWNLIAAILAALVVGVIGIQIPQVFGSIVDVITKISAENEVSFVEQICGPGLRLVTLCVVQSFFTFITITLLSGVGERIALQMRQQLFQSLLNQDLAFFDKQRTGEIMNRLTTDVQDFKSSFKLCISRGLRSLTQIVGCVGALIMVSPKMTGLLMLVVPSVIVVGTCVGSILQKLSHQASEQVSRVATVAEEALSNIRTVRAFAMEGKECEMLNNEATKACELNQKLGLGVGLFQAGTNLFLTTMMLSTLCMGGYLMSRNELSPGDLTAFYMAAQSIQKSMIDMAMLFSPAVKAIGAGASVFEYINLQPKVPLTGGVRIPYHSLEPVVKFENVSFSYPTRPNQQILEDFTLTIPAGKTVAVVGSSGNGKSTVASLLARMYDADGGVISVSGKDICTLDPSWLRGRVIGFINQEPVLFATSIMENIRYAKPTASDEEVYAAARQAHAHDFIELFPHGYNTVVGEKGVTVSGGQKQRIAIARALLKNPSILILDEATSALDAESEKTVQKALESASKGRTVLVIAHRLSTVKNADVIVVLQKGHIVEMGTHEELKKKRGYYWMLVQNQEILDRKTG